jgi:hypothetical protein
LRALSLFSQIRAQSRVVLASRLRRIWSFHTSFQSISVIGFMVNYTSEAPVTEIADKRSTSR